MSAAEDRELESFRKLIEPPDKFSDGFGWQTVLGALFLGLIVTPGSIYISLVAGENVGPAARWVTIILFAEMARRSLKELTHQQSFIIYYMTFYVLIQNAQQTGLLWYVYMAQSDAMSAMGISSQFPDWLVPQRVVEGGEVTTFLTKEFIGPILLVASALVITRIDHFGLGYFLYRLTSDVERLPFPVAPVEASGILSMAETKDKSEPWRPACFSIGSMIGGAFGFFYLGIPMLTDVFFNQPIQLLPLPWIEFTDKVDEFIPATAVNFVPNLAFVFLGMVLPFWAVVGGFAGLLITMILNPILYDGGILKGLGYNGGVLSSWRPGMKTVDTIFLNNVDFYFSFGLGITFFIAFLGLWQGLKPIFRDLLKLASSKKGEAGEDQSTSGYKLLITKNEKRGDISIWVALSFYVLSTVSYIAICFWLLPGVREGHVLFFLLGYGFIYTPIIAYAAAKLEGLTGQALAIPLVREATFIVSGYKGVGLWFAPIPYHNYTQVVRDFRVMELTGTKLKSVIKTDILTIPVFIISLVVFSSVIISQGPLDSERYPYVQQVWELQAKNTGLMVSSTVPGRNSVFDNALKPAVILVGFLGALGMYGVLNALSLPILLIYGVVRGLGQTNPMSLVPEFIGAMVGRFYFQRKFGENWRKYTPPLYAGFVCGMGLLGMAAVAIKLLSTTVGSGGY